MKVICAWCQKDLGEKCGKCGGTQIATILLTLLTPNKETMPLFYLQSWMGKRDTSLPKSLPAAMPLANSPGRGESGSRPTGYAPTAKRSNLKR